MALTPLLSIGARHLAPRLTSSKAVDPELAARPAGGHGHAIVVGYGRVGKVVCALLTSMASPISRPIRRATVTHDRRDNHDVYYGDAADPRFLETCGLADAAAVIITIHTARVIDEIVEHVRAFAARHSDRIARERRRARPAPLQSWRNRRCAGDDEASLQLSEAALVGLGVATGLAIASIHEKRDEIRHALQEAAQEAGRDRIHSIKTKTPRSGRHSPSPQQCRSAKKIAWARKNLRVRVSRRRHQRDFGVTGIEPRVLDDDRHIGFEHRRKIGIAQNVARVLQIVETQMQGAAWRER